MLKGFLAGICCFLFAGCTHSVSYRLAPNDRWTGPVIDKTIYVQTLADESVVVTNTVERIDSEYWRTNYRKGYAKTDLAAQVSAMVAKHLSYSGLFRNVIIATNANADFSLSGTLADYSTRGRINSTAEGVQAGSAGFGLIGGLVGGLSTMHMKTEIRVSVQLENLKLSGNRGEVLWHDSIGVKTNFPAHFSAAESGAIFNHPDNALKEAVSKLIFELGNSALTNGLQAAK